MSESVTRSCRCIGVHTVAFSSSGTSRGNSSLPFHPRAMDLLAWSWIFSRGSSPATWTKFIFYRDNSWREMKRLSQVDNRLISVDTMVETFFDASLVLSLSLSHLFNESVSCNRTLLTISASRQMEIHREPGNIMLYSGARMREIFYNNLRKEPLYAQCKTEPFSASLLCI